MQVNNQWTKGMSDKDKADMLVRLGNSDLLKRLAEILQDRLEALEVSELPLSSYETPAWAYRQADINGAKRELKQILNLIQIR